MDRPSDEAVCRALKILAEAYIKAVSGEEVTVTYTKKEAPVHGGNRERAKVS